jgi:hypothetical protein
VVWGDGTGSRHRSTELYRVPVCDQDPALWESAQIAAN